MECAQSHHGKRCIVRSANHFVARLGMMRSHNFQSFCSNSARFRILACDNTVQRRRNRFSDELRTKCCALHWTKAEWTKTRGWLSLLLCSHEWQAPRAFPHGMVLKFHRWKASHRWNSLLLSRTSDVGMMFCRWQTVRLPSAKHCCWLTLTQTGPLSLPHGLANFCVSPDVADLRCCALNTLLL